MEKSLLKEEISEKLSLIELTELEEEYLNILEDELAHGNAGAIVYCSCSD